MRTKTFEFPLIKFREGDRMPAVWYSSGFWFLIRDALCRKYLDARSGMGERQAKIEMKKATDLDLWPFDAGTADDAIRYYKIGWNAHQIKERLSILSPEELIQRGNTKQNETYNQVKSKLEKEANEQTT